MMTDLSPAVTRRTYEDYLIARRAPHDIDMPCPVCGVVTAAFSLLAVDDVQEIEGPVCCGNCFLSAARPRVEVAPPTTDGWDSDLGKSIKVRRDMELDAVAWAVRPTSPLSDACVALWHEYIIALHRLTLNYPEPQSAVFPDRPGLDYCTEAEARERAGLSP